jgi:hypothetical protein
VPVEDIYTFPGSLIRCCVLYSFFASGESLTNAINAINIFYVWKLVGNFSRPEHPLFPQTSAKPENSQLQLQQQEIFSLVFILPFNNKFIPCCDDERCVFVETARTSVASTNCAEGVMCIACVDLGYLLARAQLPSLLDLFILKLQQDIPSLFSRSSQHVRENFHGVSLPQQRSIKLFRFRSAG